MSCPNLYIPCRKRCRIQCRIRSPIHYIFICYPVSWQVACFTGRKIWHTLSLMKVCTADSAAVPRRPREHPSQRCFLLRHVPPVIISEHARVPGDQGDRDLRICAHLYSCNPLFLRSRNPQDSKAVGGLLGDFCRPY